MDGESADTPRGREEAHGFLDDHFGVGQAREIGESWWSAGEDDREFGVELLSTSGDWAKRYQVQQRALAVVS